MKQTAVEHLENEIQKNIIPAQKEYFKWAFEQAKEMEKEQQGYSNEEVLKFLINCPTNTEKETIEWFEQFKKK